MMTFEEKISALQAETEQEFNKLEERRKAFQQERPEGRMEKLIEQARAEARAELEEEKKEAKELDELIKEVNEMLAALEA